MRRVVRRIRARAILARLKSGLLDEVSYPVLLKA
jgi:hypothetical protein